MNLAYPAIITQEDNVFYIGFPDFKSNNGEDFIYSTYGDNFEDTLKMGLEWLILTLNGYEEEKKDFPKATSIVELKKNLKDNQEIAYLTFNYEYEKSLIKHHYVKKTLTIPNYLNILAQNKNINFSQVLQNALKKELDLEK